VCVCVRVHVCVCVCVCEELRVQGVRGVAVRGVAAATAAPSASI